MTSIVAGHVSLPQSNTTLWIILTTLHGHYKNMHYKRTILIMSLRNTLSPNGIMALIIYIFSRHILGKDCVLIHTTAADRVIDAMAAGSTIVT